MGIVARARYLFGITHGREYARRYFFTNGFDCALTLLGVTLAFESSQAIVPLAVVINACVGAAVALSVSSFSSTYLSEAGEQRKRLRELEKALLTSLERTDHGHGARIAPVLVAAVSAAAPLVVATIVIAPLACGNAGLTLPLSPIPAAIVAALAVVFGMGALFGRTGGGGLWLVAGLRAAFVAGLTAAIIWLLAL